MLQPDSGRVLLAYTALSYPSTADMCRTHLGMSAPLRISGPTSQSLIFFLLSV
jgi:hypothetical protein